jgi:hypothetical protein
VLTPIRTSILCVVLFSGVALALFANRRDELGERERNSTQSQPHAVTRSDQSHRLWPAFRQPSVPNRRALPGITEGLAISEVASFSNDGPEQGEKLVALIDEYFATKTDRQIIEVLSELTNFSEEELEDVRDLREFVGRLASAWLGPLDPKPGKVEEIQEASIEPVEFSRRVDLENRPRRDRAHFDSKARKIYATFPTDERFEDQVIVVWRDLDRSKVLAFDRYPIESSQAFNFVWMKQPAAWKPGAYSVEIYTGDSAVKPIAKGTYRVAAD